MSHNYMLKYLTELRGSIHMTWAILWMSRMTDWTIVFSVDVMNILRSPEWAMDSLRPALLISIFQSPRLIRTQSAQTMNDVIRLIQRPFARRESRAEISIDHCSIHHCSINHRLMNHSSIDHCSIVFALHYCHRYMLAVQQQLCLQESKCFHILLSVTARKASDDLTQLITYDLFYYSFAKVVCK